MNPSWQYPIYLIPHGGGYASIVDPDSSDQPVHHLAVYDELRMAIEFMHDFSILGAPRPMQNDREFLWLLQSLQAPVTQVALNPQPNDDGLRARWTISVRELMDDHLTVEYSPWNYPIYVVALDAGFICIGGQSNDGRDITAIGVFSNEALANKYLEAAGESGTTCELTSVEQATRFFSALDGKVAAAALDPVINDGRHTAKHCFELETLLTKYLVLDEEKT